MTDAEASYWDSSVFWFDDELTLDNGWFNKSQADQDSTMMHEISHGQDTEDDNHDDPYNNAHAIDNLMKTDKDNWIFYKFDKRKADQKCGHN